jgi:hypothetical protein
LEPLVERFTHLPKQRVSPAEHVSVAGSPGHASPAPTDALKVRLPYLSYAKYVSPVVATHAPEAQLQPLATHWVPVELNGFAGQCGLEPEQAASRWQASVALWQTFPASL